MNRWPSLAINFQHRCANFTYFISLYSFQKELFIELSVDKCLDERSVGLRQSLEVPGCVAERWFPNHRWQRLRGGSPQSPKQSRNPGHTESLCRVKQISPQSAKGNLSSPSLHCANEILMGRSAEACRDSRSHRGVTRYGPSQNRDPKDQYIRRQIFNP